MEGLKNGSQKGVISRTFDHIFEAIAVTTGVKYLALVSYLEIYNEQIRDLLQPSEKITNSNSLILKETPNEGVTVPGTSSLVKIILLDLKCWLNFRFDVPPRSQCKWMWELPKHGVKKSHDRGHTDEPKQFKVP